MRFITNILSCSKAMPLFMALIAASALGMALLSQYVGGLHPCNLCIWQRWPYGIVILLGLIGFGLSYKSKKTVSAAMILIGITYFVNSIIAFYHSGVERLWWKSFLEGCSVPDLGSDPDNILEALEASPVARCDEIPWADAILGLSMANYNVVFCLGLAALSFYSAYKIIFLKRSN